MSVPPGRQLVLDLATRPALGRVAFFVSRANSVALAQIDRWPDWPERRMAIAGPAGAGKTHLVHVWAAASGARILTATELDGLDPGAVPGDAALAVEDVDRIAAMDPATGARAEETLFHLCNRLLLGGGSLLVTGRGAPGRWTIALPDLASRLRALSVATLEPPDDRLLAAVLVKLFGDRQIDVAPELIDYLLPRMDRSFEAAETLVAALDRAGMSRRRRITPRLAAEVLAAPG